MSEAGLRDPTSGLGALSYADRAPVVMQIMLQGVDGLSNSVGQKRKVVVSAATSA